MDNKLEERKVEKVVEKGRNLISQFPFINPKYLCNLERNGGKWKLSNAIYITITVIPLIELMSYKKKTITYSNKVILLGEIFILLLYPNNGKET